MEEKPGLGNTVSFFRPQTVASSPIERCGVVVYIGSSFDLFPKYDPSSWRDKSDYDEIVMGHGKVRFNHIEPGEVIIRVDRKQGAKELPSWYYAFHYRKLLLVK
jgi:hypothetical protein